MDKFDGNRWWLDYAYVDRSWAQTLFVRVAFGGMALAWLTLVAYGIAQLV